MSGNYSVPLRKVIKTHSFETIYMPDKPDSELVIRSQDVNRPGLLFAGYEKYFGTHGLFARGSKTFKQLSVLSHEV